MTIPVSGFCTPGEEIAKWSQVDIDADKDWGAFGITNLKELAAAMNKGDMLFFDSTKLLKITPGSIGTNLTTHDIGNDPTWEYPP